jgi:hypothetical protein
VFLLGTACIEEHPDFATGSGQTAGEPTSGTTGDPSTGTTTGASTSDESGRADAGTSTTSGLDDDSDGSGDTEEPECTVEVCDTLPGCDCCDALGEGETDGETDGEGQREGDPCYSGDWDLVGMGVCQAGAMTCKDGVWVCEGEVLPSDEECNGLDDNCDGQVDDGFGQVTCGIGICQKTIYECVNGQSNTCVPGDPEPEELCNGLDDTCDGQVDTGCSCVDGEQQQCYTGPNGTVNVGICKHGSQICSGGAWGACQGDTTPASEICNGLDDDCNGLIDDGNPGGGGLCNTGLLGVCQIGVMQCQSGSLHCMQTTFPSDEVCDGQDNNCNGQVDEGNPGGGAACNTGLPGICAAGTMTCTNGSLQCVQNNQSQPEVCGDGLDNNCNGIVDDGCPCAHSKCTTGVALVAGCDPCVEQICASMPSCCSTNWTSSCVNAVQTICKCGNCNWGCTHTLCETGGPLTSGCDPGCVADVCAVDPYCCNNGWDNICRARAGTGQQFPQPTGYIAGICNLSCNC